MFARWCRTQDGVFDAPSGMELVRRFATLSHDHYLLLYRIVPTRTLPAPYCGQRTHAGGRNVGIGVDVHVHRITNRLGWHAPPTKNPEETRYVPKSLSSPSSLACP